MLKSKKPGLAIVETILVLAISGLMFVVVIGLFSTRKRAQSDDGARQVLSIIAKVRNEAQSGKGPTTEAGKNLLKCNQASSCSGVAAANNEIFGQAIKFYTNSAGTVSYMQVMKLMQNQDQNSKAYGLISAYESEQINMPGGLLIYAPGGGNPPADYCSGFSSCYSGSLNGVINYQPLGTGKLLQSSGESLALVFKNRTGESYAFAFVNYTNTLGVPSKTAQYPTAPNPIGAWRVLNNADNIADYEPDNNGTRQGNLRLALIAPGTGSTLTSKAANATARYYINFDLSIPNNQSLEVVK